MNETSLLKKLNNLEIKNKELEKDALKLKEDSLRYELLFESSDDAILVIEDGKFINCNHAVVKMLGYKNKNELLNTHPSELSPEKQPDGKLSYIKAEEMMRNALENGSHHFEWIHTKANGENFPVEVWLSSVKYMGKTLINTIWRDLTEIKKADAKIKASLSEKEILLKEIHHRVKNNMQIISSLLNLQAETNDDIKIKEQFKTCKYRIKSMAIIHEMLYNSEDFSKINYSDYLHQLSSHLLDSIKGNSNNVVINLNANGIRLNMDTAIPLGLLINEVITNSLKYGFNDDTKGELYITIEKLKENKYIMLIGDNGVGFSVDLKKDDSLGLELIEDLSLQLFGVLERDLTKKGTHYILNFEELYQEVIN